MKKTESLRSGEESRTETHVSGCRSTHNGSCTGVSHLPSCLAILMRLTNERMFRRSALP